MLLAFPFGVDFLVSSGEHTPREKAKISIKRVTSYLFRIIDVTFFCFLQSL